MIIVRQKEYASGKVGLFKGLFKGGKDLVKGTFKSLGKKRAANKALRNKYAAEVEAKAAEKTLASAPRASVAAPGKSTVGQADPIAAKYKELESKAAAAKKAVATTSKKADSAMTKLNAANAQRSSGAEMMKQAIKQNPGKAVAATGGAIYVNGKIKENRSVASSSEDLNAGVIAMGPAVPPKVSREEVQEKPKVTSEPVKPQPQTTTPPVTAAPSTPAQTTQSQAVSRSRVESNLLHELDNRTAAKVESGIIDKPIPASVAHVIATNEPKPLTVSEAKANLANAKRAARENDPVYKAKQALRQARRSERDARKAERLETRLDKAQDRVDRIQSSLNKVKNNNYL